MFKVTFYILQLLKVYFLFIYFKITIFTFIINLKKIYYEN